MNTGRTIFSQVMDILRLRDFHKCVARYRGQYKVRKFSCLDQFLCMAFAQLTYRESLRDIEACLRAMQPKLYMGIRTRVSRSTLDDAERGVNVFFDDYPDEEDELLEVVEIERHVIRLVTSRRQYTLNVQGVDHEDMKQAKRVSRQTTTNRGVGIQRISKYKYVDTLCRIG